MKITATEVAVFFECWLAAGRVAYSITNDEIFRPLREAIYLRSAPRHDTILVFDQGGDREISARQFHPVNEDGHPFEGAGIKRAGYDWIPELEPRRPGWAGQLFECPFCMSAWTSAFFVGVWALMGTDFAALFALPFATWALANLYAVRGL